MLPFLAAALLVQHSLTIWMHQSLQYTRLAVFIRA
jgi:hypothetical protein